MEAKVDEFILGDIIERKSNDLVGQEEIQDLINRIEEYCEETKVKSMSYSDYLALKEYLGDRYDKFFKPHVFKCLCENFLLDIERFCDYISRKESLYEARIAFACYDSTYTHCLNEADLKSYIADQAKDVVEFDGLSSEMQDIYLHTTTKKFLYCLGTNRYQSVRIQDILMSPILTEFLEVKEKQGIYLDAKWEANNFFSIANVTKLYSKFKQFNKKHINSAEVFKCGVYNQFFIERFCAEIGRQGYLDWETFLMLYVMDGNYEHGNIVNVCFNVMDVNKQGYLGKPEIQFFLDPIVKRLNNQLTEKLDPSVIATELMDALMVQDKILKRDFQCKFGAMLLKILCTKSGLIEYFNSFASS